MSIAEGARGRRTREGFRLSLLFTPGIVAGAVVSAALTPSEALADCVLVGTVVTCATPDTDGYRETVSSSGVDRTVNITADVSESTRSGINIELNDGNIAINHTAGIVSVSYGMGFYLATAGDITGTFSDIDADYSGIYIESGDTVGLTLNGTIDAGDDAVTVLSGGSVTITNAGGADAGINGGNTGFNIWSANDLTIHNDGSKITAGRYGSGIFAYSVDDFVTITNEQGSIASGDTGVAAWDIGGPVTIANQGGSILGTRSYAIDIYGVGGAVSLDNSFGGRIESERGYGISTYDVSGDVDLDNEGGLIRGGSGAIYAQGKSVAIVNGGATDDAGTYHPGFITGGTSGSRPVIFIDSDSYDADTGEGGARLENKVGGLIAGDAISSSGALDAEEVAAAVDDLVIQATGGRLLIDNHGTLIGRVQLTGEDDVLNNSGSDGWTVSGENDFGEGSDAIYNAGRIAIIGDASFQSLDHFYNYRKDIPSSAGAIDMRDDDAGSSLSIDGDYHGGENGRLRLDTDFASSTSDQLHVAGQATGMTLLDINALNADWASYDPDGILVVDVAGGAAAANTFALANGPIAAGFFSYDLVHAQGTGGDSWYLRSEVNGYADQLVDLGIAASQLWHQSVAAWSDRTTDLRGFIHSGAPSPAIDPRRTGDGGTTALTHNALGPGVWGRAFGTQASWNDTDQRSWGFQAGVDVPVSITADGGLILGALAGYAQSDLDFDAANSSGRLTGQMLGAYATYVDGQLYVDAVAKIDLLEIDYAAQGDSTDTDGISSGARVEAGYRIDVAPAAFIEPRASLTYVRTDIDGFEMMGSSVHIDDGESFHGTLGLRAGLTLVVANGLLAAPYVSADIGNEFAGDFAAALDTGGLAVTVADDIGGTFGQLGAGLELHEANGVVSTFARAGYRFDETFDSFSGSAGFRLIW